ncbi:hypothetical protein Tco_1038943 [Tanacetum coccineum]
MTETTMEEYMTRTRKDYGSGLARPKFDKDAKFELKGQFLKELRDHTFSELEIKDANEHIERVLEIVYLLTTPDVTQDQLMLRVCPITKLELQVDGLGMIQGTFIEISSTLMTSMQEVILFYKGLDVPTR